VTRPFASFVTVTFASKQCGVAATGGLLQCRPADASLRVRESPPASVLVVTQFVTHLHNGLVLNHLRPRIVPRKETA
jgi:hypothetical protein